MTQSGPSSSERRHPRYHLTAFVDLTGAIKHPYQRVQNLSLGGVCIHTPAQEQPGTVVDLVIFFPDLDTTFEAEGVVVWVSDDTRMDMGIRFRDVDEGRQEVLQKYIELVNTRSMHH